MLMDYKQRCPIDLPWLDILGRIKDKTPFIVVCLQEVERMNILLGEIRKSLEDLRLGLTGALNITDSMENL
jgi:dynein heavy chain, axonemal